MGERAYLVIGRVLRRMERKTTTPSSSEQRRYSSFNCRGVLRLFLRFQQGKKHRVYTAAG